MIRLSSFSLAGCLLLTGSLFASEGTEWDYDGAEGPEAWGQLDASFDMCERGRNQSPINLVADVDADLPAVSFDYHARGFLEEMNTGHAIQINVRPGNSVTFRDEVFELKQFHFHSPSEHTVKGKSYPMEVHFVHQHEDGALLVVGLLFEEGPRNVAMDELPSFRAARGLEPSTEPIDYNALILDRDQFYLYNGSLTTPPCSEGVEWVVMKSPIIASQDQIEHYYALLGFDNNRPVQPRHARIILE